LVFWCFGAQYAAGKIVCLDCHGPIALTNCKKANGEALVKGLKVTGFTDAEEAAVGLTDKVPFLVEKKFRELGADFSAAADWNVNVCVDGKLITGQNPQSSAKCAQTVIGMLA
jgi:putative intracellular protease/amidase